MNQNNYDLKKDPRLKNIDPVKLNIIMEIKEQSRHQSIEELLPQIMQINKELNRRNINFTKEESALLLDVIEETLPPADKKKFKMLKSFL